MWILPNNYQLSSAFAQDMVASKEDLTLPGLNIESSLMWRSKPSPLPTWLRRWKPDSWFQRLSSRILKPSQRTSFEAALTLSLEATRASRFQQQVSGSAPKTPDTSGPSSDSTFKQLDLFGACLKTSKDTSALDSEKSLAIWKAQVIKQRGEYSQRLKSMHLTRENEFTLWQTPVADDSVKRTNGKINSQGEPKLSAQVKNWPTPNTWPTVRVSSANGASQKELQAGNPKRRLETEVLLHPWPTPSTRDHKDHLGMAKTSINKDGTIRNRVDQLARKVFTIENTQPSGGHLNPDWVEWLMGVPIGWTGLDSWGTE